MEDSAWWIAIGLAYLSGSIPYALLIGRLRGVDIREHGSGNVGATNCGRVLGRPYGFACFILDVAKGMGPVLWAGYEAGLIQSDEITAGQAGWWLGVAVAAVAGHVLPVWLKFKGGKGVATGFGVLLGVWPFLTVPAVGALGTWITIVIRYRYVSLSSIAAAVMLPVYFVVTAIYMDWWWSEVWPFLVVVTGMAVLIVVRHTTNLKRLRAGKESKIGIPDEAADTDLDAAPADENDKE
jgi:glycerol-3-phosphate acyltransferase PlsY